MCVSEGEEGRVGLGHARLARRLFLPAAASAKGSGVVVTLEVGLSWSSHFSLDAYPGGQPGNHHPPASLVCLWP